MSSSSLSQVIPPENFSMVHNGIFRSRLPRDDNFGFLNSLGLRSIIFFRPENCSMFATIPLNAYDVELFQFNLDGGKERFEKGIRDALRVVVDVTKHPVLIVCAPEFVQRKHCTGYLVGCFRRLQRWCLSSVFNEFRRFAAANVGGSDERVIEFFDLSSFMQSPSLHREGLKSPLSPPENFSMVHNGIFKSDLPRDDNISFLKSLGLRSIIFFHSENCSLFAKIPLYACNVELFEFNLDGGKERFEKGIRDALRVVVDVTKHPVLITLEHKHCGSAMPDVTKCPDLITLEHKHCAGYLLGCFRRLQQWCLLSVFEEFRRFAAAEVGESDERFIKLFDLSSFR